MEVLYSLDCAGEDELYCCVSEWVELCPDGTFLGEAAGIASRGEVHDQVKETSVGEGVLKGSDKGAVGGGEYMFLEFEAGFYFLAGGNLAGHSFHG